MTDAARPCVAVIDVGSNSALLLVLAIADGFGRAIDEAAVTTRLGARLEGPGMLDGAAMDRTATTVVALAARARRAGAERVFVFATGAVRRARNGPAFAHRLAEAIGEPVDVLTGAEEAQYAYDAVGQGLGLTRAPGPLLTADVGGGTTELTLGHGEVIAWQTSLPLGALALHERFGADAAARDAFVARVLRSAGIPERPGVVAASGGTATTLAALSLGLPQYDARRVHGHTLDRTAVIAVVEKLGRPPLPAVLDAGRAEILPAGACILVAVMDCVSRARLLVSDHGVRHGYLRRRLAEAGVSLDFGALWG